MMKHKDLYCDEGAIVMATLDHQLNLKTRLVDILGADSIAHHTVLQVYDGGKWTNADFEARAYDSTLLFSANKIHTYLAGERIKAYPKPYNFIVNNNFFLKKIALKLRNVDESGQ